jgi:hypothetical protein
MAISQNAKLHSRYILLPPKEQPPAIEGVFYLGTLFAHCKEFTCAAANALANVRGSRA